MYIYQQSRIGWDIPASAPLSLCVGGIILMTLLALPCSVSPAKTLRVCVGPAGSGAAHLSLFLLQSDLSV